MTSINAKKSPLEPVDTTIDRILDQRLPHFTPSTFKEALVGFSLQLVSGTDVDNLAIEVRRAMALAMSGNEQSKATTRDNLRKLVADIRVVESRVAELPAPERAILAMTPSQAPSPYDPRQAWTRNDRMVHVLDELRWLADVLAAAEQIATDAAKSQRGRWKGKKAREQRVAMAYFLAPIFATAFGRRATANDWTGDGGGGKAKGPTAFMDFYQRMARAAFDEKATPDLAGVLRDALSID